MTTRVKCWMPGRRAEFINDSVHNLWFSFACRDGHLMGDVMSWFKFSFTCSESTEDPDDYRATSFARKAKSTLMGLNDQNRWTFNAREFESTVGHVGFRIIDEVCITWNEEKHSLFLHRDYSYMKANVEAMPANVNSSKRKQACNSFRSLNLHKDSETGRIMAYIRANHKTHNIPGATS
ncbi:hypothetical protein QBC38DRAFT_439534 [Podospora fimiseda]|uniref:Uncharacterized protein n=1 Tax=Podospora fimiseda TaxID=252190 RepID=A0AAN7H5I5_9PEZI|nr:hypothetical protein QBC38DRAFT_439534 [Podospora fimiseda]